MTMQYTIYFAGPYSTTKFFKATPCWHRTSRTFREGVTVVSFLRT